MLDIMTGHLKCYKFRLLKPTSSMHNDTTFQNLWHIRVIQYDLKRRFCVNSDVFCSKKSPDQSISDVKNANSVDRCKGTNLQ